MYCGGIKYEKRIMLLALPFLLASSCGAECPTCPEAPECEECQICPETPAPDAINEMLKDLGDGFSVESKIFVTQYFGKNSSGEDSYSWYTVCKDVDVSGDSILSTAYDSDYLSTEEVESGEFEYLHGEEDLGSITIFGKNPDNSALSSVYLGLDNVIHYEDVIDTASNEALPYVSTFENPFKYLNEDDFTKVDETTYSLKQDTFKLNTIYTLLANYIFAEPIDA